MVRWDRQEIPPEHYRAVAEIIGYLMRLRRLVRSERWHDAHGGPLANIMGESVARGTDDGCGGTPLVLGRQKRQGMTGQAMTTRRLLESKLTYGPLVGIGLLFDLED